MEAKFNVSFSARRAHQTDPPDLSSQWPKACADLQVVFIQQETPDRGFIDTFREFEPGGGHYTWWSQRFGVRDKNIGWRIDYVLASPSAARSVSDAFIWPEVLGSDHCPVGVDVD